MIEPLYKVLAVRRSPHGGTGTWRPGRWRSVRGPLVACENGLHLCRATDVIDWLGPELWRAEADGERIDAGDKIVVRRARITTRVEAWNERTARLFAADCAERVLPNLPEPVRTTCAATIEVVRRYANGDATDEERFAAWFAARSAARSTRFATRSAAWSAAESAAESATRSAWQSARSAARSAAESATRSAAESAERSWQATHLIEMLGLEADHD